MPVLPGCYDYRYELPYLVYVMLGTELWALPVLIEQHLKLQALWAFRFAAGF